MFLKDLGRVGSIKKIIFDVTLLHIIDTLVFMLNRGMFYFLSVTLWQSQILLTYQCKVH